LGEFLQLAAGFFNVKPHEEAFVLQRRERKVVELEEKTE
jgi:hypothetical protein